MEIRNIAKTGSGILVLIVALIALNIITSRLSGRIDVTENKIYSLSDGTEKILDKLEGEIVARMYFSRSLKELPVAIKTYATRVEEVLAEYSLKSGGKITAEYVDPEPDTDEEEWAIKYGIQPVRLPQGSNLYFGIVLIKGATEIVMPYLDPRREEFLEYDLSESLLGLSRTSKPKIGIMTSLNVISSGGQNPYARGDDSWVLATELKKNFEVENIDPGIGEISNDYSLVIVMHPKDADDSLQYALDQYVMKGGKLIVVVDPMSRFEMANQSPQAQMMGGAVQSASSDLPKLFSSWGIKYDPNQMVGDLSRGSNINAGGQVVNYPFFATFLGEDFSDGSVITNNLNQIVFAEGGFFAFDKSETLKFEPLVTSTKDSGLANSAMAGYLPPSEIIKNMKVDDKQYVMAGLLTGKFKSAYSARPEFSEEDLTKFPSAYKAEMDTEGAVMLIADLDMFTDGNSASVMNFGGQRLVQMRNDNLNFVFNAVDYLGGSSDLISIRSRGKLARPFTKVAEIQKDAQFKWKEKEEELSAELTRLQTELGKLQQQRTDGNRLALTAEQQDKIKSFREEERKIRKERRIVRKNLREDIESLGHKLIAINMLFVPFLVSALGLGVFMRRSKLAQVGRK